MCRVVLNCPVLFVGVVWLLVCAFVCTYDCVLACVFVGLLAVCCFLSTSFCIVMWFYMIACLVDGLLCFVLVGVGVCRCVGVFVLRVGSCACLFVCLRA